VTFADMLISSGGDFWRSLGAGTTVSRFQQLHYIDK
jgi:hypothetical protein